MTLRSAARGKGTVQFGASVHNDLRPFGPLVEQDAYLYTADYTETYGEIVYDYLTPMQ